MQVKVYSTPTCHFCHMAKDFFDKNNVTYEDIDVSVDQAKAEEMVQVSGQMGVPVIVIEKEGGGEPEILVGFQESKLKELLDIK